MEPTKARTMSPEEEAAEIWVVPFFGQGHLLPSMELCKHLASRNLKTALVITSHLSSSVPSTFRHHHPLLQVLLLPASDPAPPPPPEQLLPAPKSQQAGHGPGHHHHHHQMAQALQDLLSARSRDSGLPFCAVVDIMMSWTREVFTKSGVPVIGFFTSGACSSAMEYATWKEKGAAELKAGETCLLPALPEQMALTEADLRRRPHGPPGGGPPPGLDGPLPGPPGSGPPPGLGGPPPGPPGGLGRPELGHQPPWLEETEGSVALMINTCHELEGPFLEYLSNQVGKPVWGVGPLLPEQYWKSSGSVVHDREFRSNRQSSVSEDEVVFWLDSKPRGSVLYVSFGSEVGPETKELSQLADALEESNRPFIWVIQPNSGRGPPGGPGSGGPGGGFSPDGLDQKVGDRGLIIRGWAPQLLILSHPSTGGFLSHCGWNSTAEAIGLGVPFLAWPIRGDQYFNASLVVKYLRVGCMITDVSRTVHKDDILKGIESLLGNQGFKKRAVELSGKFEHGFPRSSVASLDAFREFVIALKAE